jgi:transglutaminase-like putative cysteine protease
MVATTPRNYVPWYLRWELSTILPGALLSFVMVWSVIQSIASSNWADGLRALVGVALPALLVGIIFARLHWLPSWLAHILSAALGVAWSIQQIGGLLVEQISTELNTAMADRLVTWGDRATEILIRVIVWSRVLAVGGRGEDVVLFVVALALLCWALGYATGWLLFRSGWPWWAVLLNAMTILVNYTFAFPKPNQLFFVFLGAALLLIVHQNIIHKQHAWRLSQIEFPEFMSGRFLAAAALFCGLVVLITSLLPGNVSNAQVARVWRVVSSPLTAVREGWETAFTTINAPEGSTGNDFSTGGARVGGPRALGDAVVMRVRSSKFDYWRAVVFDRYTGRGWVPAIGERARAALGVATQVEARTPLEPGIAVPLLGIGGRSIVTETIEMAVGRNDNLIVVGGELLSAGLPVLIQHGYLVNDAGLALPNFGETAAIYSQLPLQQTRTYTVAALLSTIDEQSLRNAGTNYPEWVTNYYLQLPDTVTQRTRDKAQEIVRAANATNAYDQAMAIQNYLSRFKYDERRPQPPENRDWADFFLFEQQRGYCDDFATTMTVLLRSLNIPTRWSQGYAGGTFDAESGAYVVRQSVAHSWPEVYFPGYGWQRFEPTPASYASPPFRPARPTSESAGDSGSSIPSDFTGQSELDRLRELEDRLNGQQGDIEASRRALAERLAAERRRRLVIGGGFVAALLAGIALFFIRLRRDVAGLSPASAAYVRLGRMAAWAGLGQGAHVTPYEYAGELGRSLPNHRVAVDRIVDAYVEERYKPGEVQLSPALLRAEADELKQGWKSLRPSLLGRMLLRLGAAARPRARQNGRRDRWQ